MFSLKFLGRYPNGLLWQFLGHGVTMTTPTQVGNGWNIMTVIAGGLDYTGDGIDDVLARQTTGAFWIRPGAGTGFTGPISSTAGGMHSACRAERPLFCRQTSLTLPDLQAS